MSNETTNKYMAWYQTALQKIKGIWPWYKGLYKGRPWYIKTLVTMASLIVAFFLYLGAVDMNFLWLFGKSPSMSTIKNKRPAEASMIYSADGKLIGKFFSENRTPVTYEEVNPVFWKALIDTEDERFYRHHGIDYQAFAAALKDYALHHDARGAWIGNLPHDWQDLHLVPQAREERAPLPHREDRTQSSARGTL